MAPKDFSKEDIDFFERKIGLPPKAMHDELVRKIQSNQYRYEYTEEPKSQKQPLPRKGILVIANKGMFLYHKNTDKDEYYVIDDSVENILNTYAEYSSYQTPLMNHISD